MYSVILADLKQDFPSRKILTLAEVAGQIGKSPMAIFKLMERGNLTIPFKKIGGKWEITIYALAQWLADQAEGVTEQKVKAVKVSVEPVKKKPRAGIPISKILFGFQANIQQMQEEVDFYSELFRELERIELLRDKDKLPMRTRPDF